MSSRGWYSSINLNLLFGDSINQRGQNAMLIRSPSEIRRTGAIGFSVGR